MKIFQLHKRQGVTFDSIQDKYAIDSEKLNFCIADGASQGFLSEEWAKMIVDNFIAKPTFEIDSLIENFKKIANDFSSQEFESSDIPAIRAIENRKKQEGSYATFLGVNISNDTLSYISSGDCCGFIVGPNNMKSFPFDSLDELSKDKGFIGTQKLIKNEIEAHQFKNGTFSISPLDKIILCTDAIARFLFINPDEVSKIISQDNFESFKDWVSEKIDNKLLEDDDITILSFSINNIKDVNYILPPKNFMFPKSESSVIKSHKQPNPKEKKKMLEIQNKIELLENRIQSQNIEINNLNSDLKSLKKKIFIIVGIMGLIFSGYMIFNLCNLKKSDRTETISLINNTNKKDIKTSQFSNKDESKIQVIKESNISDSLVGKIK